MPFVLNIRAQRGLVTVNGDYHSPGSREHIHPDPRTVDTLGNSTAYPYERFSYCPVTLMNDALSNLHFDYGASLRFEVSVKQKKKRNESFGTSCTSEKDEKMDHGQALPGL